MKGLWYWATTYSSTGQGSTIGAVGLNFSVRNGKRCAPTLLSPQCLSVSLSRRMGFDKGRKKKSSPEEASSLAETPHRGGLGHRHALSIEQVSGD